MSNDLTFFTNEQDATLLDRFTRLLQHVKHFDGFTDEDEEYIRLATKAFQEGIIPQNTAKKTASEIKKGKGFNPLKILGVLKHNIPDSLLLPEQAGKGSQYHARREVILSEYIIAAG